MTARTPPTGRTHKVGGFPYQGPAGPLVIEGVCAASPCELDTLRAALKRIANLAHLSNNPAIADIAIGALTSPGKPSEVKP